MMRLAAPPCTCRWAAHVLLPSTRCLPPPVCAAGPVRPRLHGRVIPRAAGREVQPLASACELRPPPPHRRAVDCGRLAPAQAGGELRRQRQLCMLRVQHPCMRCVAARCCMCMPAGRRCRPMAAPDGNGICGAARAAAPGAAATGAAAAAAACAAAYQQGRQRPGATCSCLICGGSACWTAASCTAPAAGAGAAGAGPAGGSAVLCAAASRQV